MQLHGLGRQSISFGIAFYITSRLLIQTVGLCSMRLDPRDLGVSRGGVTPCVSVHHDTCILFSRCQSNGRRGAGRHDHIKAVGFEMTGPCDHPPGGTYPDVFTRLGCLGQVPRHGEVGRPDSVSRVIDLDRRTSSTG